MALILSILSFVLLVATGAAFVARRGVLLSALGGVFVPLAGAATVTVWWPLSPTLATVILIVGIAAPLGLLMLYVVDRVWAPFCVEMTYAMVLSWLFWPALVVANLAGAAGRLLGGAIS